MFTLVALLGVAIQAGTTPDWLQQVLRADRLLAENRRSEAEAELLSAQRTADGFGRGEFPSGAVAFQLGNLYYQCGRLLDAETSFEYTVDVFDRTLGIPHHATVEATIQLSTIYLETNQTAKAAALLRRHLAADALASGDRAGLLSDLASVLMKQGQMEEAERTYRDALTVFQLDPRPPSRERALIAVSNLSVICLNTGRLPEAISLAQQALSGLSDLPAPSPALRVRTIANAAIARAASRDRPDEADRLFRSAIHICEQELAPDHFLLGPILMKYADFLKKMNRKSEAASMRKRGRAIQSAFVRGNALGYTVDASALRGSAAK